MPPLSKKLRLDRILSVRRQCLRGNSVSLGRRWGNHRSSLESSSGRLFYNYYRTYDPATGRYLESDPIGLNAGPNTYAYVGNVPTMYVDPFGLLEVRAHKINTPAGTQTTYRFDFNPISGDPSDLSLFLSRKARQAMAFIDFIRPEPVGPRRPVEDYLECGLLDAKLRDSYEAWFNETRRRRGVSEEEAIDWLNAMRDRYPEMRRLYGSPISMLEQANVNAKQHLYYQYFED